MRSLLAARNIVNVEAKVTMAANLTLSQGWSNSLYLGRECQKGSGLVLLCQMEIARQTIRYRGNID
jgi:hypothetical protein